MSKAASPSISTTAIKEVALAVTAAADCRLMALVGAKASDAESKAATVSRRKENVVRDMVML